MAKPRLGIGALIDVYMNKYQVPAWTRPYVYKYATKNTVSTIKFAISLIDVGRKKGALSKDGVRLPNGTTIPIESIARLVNVFFYGKERIAGIELSWTKSRKVQNPKYEQEYKKLSTIDHNQARAIRNMIEGMGRKVGDEPDVLSPILEELSSIEDWRKRVIATGIVVNYSYVKTFGSMFFKAFYSVVPEYMRTLGKAFVTKETAERWDVEEARRIIKDGEIEEQELIEFVEELLVSVKKTIDLNMKMAKLMGLEAEIELLEEIALAYPLNTIKDLGVDIDVQKILGRIYRSTL
jgi:hypothetical protein